MQFSDVMFWACLVAGLALVALWLSLIIDLRRGKRRQDGFDEAMQRAYDMLERRNGE